MRRTIVTCCCALAVLLSTVAPTLRAEPLLPKHITAETVKRINRGLEYLAKTQAGTGAWQGTQDAATYPVTMTSLAGLAFLANGNTTSRGPYAENVRRAVLWVLDQQGPSGLIAGAGGESGHSMYGHGFGTLFLATAYGMETDARIRLRMKKVITDAIALTAAAQSPMGGWIYTPGGGGDEGSVTVTQMQGLRAASNAGFTVPKATVENAVKYLEHCRTPEGGIRYSFNSDPSTRLAISAAAIACLYSAGEYESPLAEQCLNYVFRQFELSKNFSKGGGHDFYTHLYASQAFYQAGDEQWTKYFPAARDQLTGMQGADGQWNGDGIGPVYGTAIALIVLQLPYKFLPIYQR